MLRFVNFLIVNKMLKLFFNIFLDETICGTHLSINVLIFQKVTACFRELKQGKAKDLLRHNLFWIPLVLRLFHFYDGCF